MNRLSPSAILAAAILAGLAAPAPAQDAPKPAPNPCLRVGQLYDFKALPGNRALIVTDNFRKKFKVTLMSYCRDLDFNMTLGFKALGGSQLSCLSRGDTVISRDVTGPPDRCIIQKIENYTPEMEHADAVQAALSKKDKNR